MVISKLLSVGQPVWRQTDEYCPCELEGVEVSFNARPFHRVVMSPIYEVFSRTHEIHTILNDRVREAADAIPS